MCCILLYVALCKNLLLAKTAELITMPMQCDAMHITMKGIFDTNEHTKNKHDTHGMERVGCISCCVFERNTVRNRCKGVRMQMTKCMRTLNSSNGSAFSPVNYD